VTSYAQFKALFGSPDIKPIEDVEVPNVKLIYGTGDDEKE
jgi:hypothetical protein